MKVKYDKSSDAMYIDFEQGKKQDRVEGDWPINVDVSADGTVLGIEIMNAKYIIDNATLREISNGTKTSL